MIFFLFLCCLLSCSTHGATSAHRDRVINPSNIAEKLLEQEESGVKVLVAKNGTYILEHVLANCAACLRHPQSLDDEDIKTIELFQKSVFEHCENNNIPLKYARKNPSREKRLSGTFSVESYDSCSTHSSHPSSPL